MSGSEGVKSLPVHPVMRPSLGSSHKRSVLADTGTVLSDVSLAIVQSPDRPSWEAVCLSWPQIYLRMKSREVISCKHSQTA